MYNIGAQDYYEKGSKGMYVFSIIILCTIIESPIKDTIQNLYVD